jgi:hypothetical protein
VENSEQRQELLARTQEFWPEGSPDRLRLEQALAEEELPKTREQLQTWIEQKRNDATRLEHSLNSPERYFNREIVMAIEVQSMTPDQAANLMRIARAPSARPTDEQLRTLIMMSINLAIWPWLIWPFFAFVFRGGLGYLLSGVTLVRADGTRAGRFRCAFREILGWMPLWIVMQTTLWLQWAVPDFVFARTFLWLLGASLLPISIAIALRNPTRGPHDRVMGTYLVPM